MRLGAHVSASGGLDKAIDRAADIGAEAAQIFVSTPRMWRFRDPPEKEVAKFKEKSKEKDVAPVFIHGSYLVNLGGGEELLGKSVDVLSKSMQAAGTIGAAGVIFHGGAHKGAGFEGMLPQAASAMQQVLSVSPEGVWLIVENSAGMGSPYRLVLRGDWASHGGGGQPQRQGVFGHPALDGRGVRSRR